MIPIFIPYRNRPDLLRKAVDSVPLRENSWQVKVINNSDGPLPKNLCAGEINPPVPLTFAQTQNWILKLAEEEWKVPFFLWMHSDAEAEEYSIEQLIHFAEQCQYQERRWSVIFTNYDSLAACNVSAFRAVGGWDTMLSWYASDNDMYRRLRLAGYEMIESGLPVKHTPSQTLNSDPKIKRCVDLEIPFRESYYKAKHGGVPGHETFLTPFNDPTEVRLCTTPQREK